jgi:hypothetical protein
MEECKIPACARDKMFLAHAVILHSFMPEDISSMEECKIPVWVRDKMSGTNKVFSHSQNCNFQRRASF